MPAPGGPDQSGRNGGSREPKDFGVKEPIMTRITCTCPTCGTVALELDELMVVVDSGSGGGWYLFDCFGCARQVVIAVPETVIAALSHLHIPLQHVPAEVVEHAATRRRSRPIGVDDLLDLMLWLQAHDDLAGGCPPRGPQRVDVGTKLPGQQHRTFRGR
jgi:hypothetical protein